MADWVHGTSPNHGMLLMSPEGALSNFWASEFTGPWSRPSLDVCYTLTCGPGWADCNADGHDGCETNLAATAAHCGACGHACALPNAAPACVNGACAVGACNLGFADCNGDAADGCETLLTSSSAGGNGLVVVTW